MIEEIIALLLGKRVGLMIALEVAGFLGFLAIGMSLMATFRTPLVLIPFLLASLICFIDGATRIISESDFKRRIAKYIVEGELIRDNYNSDLVYKTYGEYLKR